MDSASPPGHINSPMRAENDRKEVQGLDSLKKGLEVDQVRSVDSKGASWVEVAQEKKVLKKYDVEVSSKDGIHKVEIPDEVLENSTPLWEDFVVGKFLDLAFHVAKVHMVLNKIWKYGDSTTKVDVYEVNPTTMRFKVSSQKAREKIFRRGMWNIACVPMVVTKWTPRSEEEKREEEAIPMWVHLEKVPLHMYSWEGISFFTSTVGYPVKLHPETIACTNLEVAKVFVKVDVSKLLPKKITFSKDKKQFSVKYYYPWLPARLSEKEVVPEVESNEEINSLSMVEESMQSEDKIERVSNGVMEHEEGKGGGEKVKAWSLVSPGKIGRMYVSPTNDSEIQISASKFSILRMNEEEEGEIISDEQRQEDTEMDDEDLIEENVLEQQVREEVKAGRRGQKAKPLDANPVKSISKAWIIVGDFNEILDATESSGFDSHGRISSGMRDFQRMVVHCNLSDMGYQGPLFTWSLLRFPNAYSVFESGGCSDHMRCKIQVLPPKEKMKRPFKFSKKLKNLKPVIRELGREKLENLTKKPKEAHAILCEKQKATLISPSNISIQEEAKAMRGGSLLRAQNSIREIRFHDGSIVTNQSEVKAEAERFFSEFLNQSPDNYEGTSTEELQEMMDFRCSVEDCRMLEKEVTEEEICRVLFDMPSNKSPGPDGYPSEFFKITWPILGQDFTVAVQSVFRYGFLPKGVNSTILALVSTKTDSMEMRDYRPTACCNVLYKVVSKILANRLKLLLLRIITENQSAFIKGRLLMENVLLASELVKDYHKEDVSPRCVMKIDISKAFDSVQWAFVLQILEALGVPEKFI
ncbi:PREDICTED: uncharacterized protein LOC106297349 [Brassica oleracea var. oleracea]|uniref:uncharacterized protein LOC106297349 n=1 Tax=Brassica oleracea var. oleracea TaxID=109376 RepID=UPI0006A6AE2B|nr:PREDICTED: uncharacterized protein LOC106297349 [Brassica oleracea var. oleracea]